MRKNVQPHEVGAYIAKKIKESRQKYGISCVGTVIQVGDGIARISGLDRIMAGELVEFSDGTLGIAFNLEANNVGVVLMGDGLNIQLRIFIFIKNIIKG